jgi:hypothetical protein
MTDFERFAGLALDDPDLRERLLSEMEVEPFVAAVIAAAAERGLAVSAPEVRSALDAANRRWIARQAR